MPSRSQNPAGYLCDRADIISARLEEPQVQLASGIRPSDRQIAEPDTDIHLSQTGQCRALREMF